MGSQKQESLRKASHRGRRESARVDSDRLNMYKNLLDEKEAALKTLAQRERDLEKRVNLLETQTHTEKSVHFTARHPYLPSQPLTEPPETSPYKKQGASNVGRGSEQPDLVTE